MKYLSIIEDYFLGKLEGEPLNRFISDVKKDPELRNEFETYKRALEFAYSQEELLIDRISELTDFEFEPIVIEDIDKYGTRKTYSRNESNLLAALKGEEIKRVRKSSIKTRRLKWIGIAAGFLILIGSGSLLLLLNPKPDNNELFRMYFTPYEHSFTTRSVAKYCNQNLEVGINYYDNGLYEKALTKLQSVPDTDEVNYEVNILKAVCYIELEKYNQALDVLEKIDKNSLLYYASRWYEGLCFLKLNEDDNASSAFKEINSFEPFYKKETRRLLKYLR